MTPETGLHPRRISRDLLLLVALCVPLYFLWPTSHGLTNWQEGIRSLVAMEMDAEGEWITPTVHGQPYLAKPPMVYWLQLTLAQVTGTSVSLLHLRLVVAAAATLGVLLTYFAGRRMLRAIDSNIGDEPGATGSAAWADNAALWSAAMLSTGILYVRSGRIGELDILLVPFVVGGAWAGFEAWRARVLRRRTNWPAVGALLLCAAGSALTKGPPGAMVLLFASCMGPLLQQGWALIRARKTGAFRELIAAWSRIHPALVVAVALGSLWGWGRLVAADIGPDAVEAAADAEAADNLRLFVPEALPRNLEACAYGVGFGSVAAIIALVWLIKDRPRLPLGAWAIAAWIGLSLLAMSVLGKGVPRYLTPVWPAIALLGGMWLASAIRDLKQGRLLARASTVIIVTLAVVQGSWYGVFRDWLHFGRSPQRLLAEVLPIAQRENADLVAIDLWHPAIDVHAGRFVEPFGLCGPETHFTIGAARPIDQLRARAADRPVIALMREDQPPNAPQNAELPPPPELLEAEGFTVVRISTDSFFLVDSLRTTVSAYWVSVDRTAVPDPGE